MFLPLHHPLSPLQCHRKKLGQHDMIWQIHVGSPFLDISEVFINALFQNMFQHFFRNWRWWRLNFKKALQISTFPALSDDYFLDLDCWRTCFLLFNCWDPQQTDYLMFLCLQHLIFCFVPSDFAPSCDCYFFLLLCNEVK